MAVWVLVQSIMIRRVFGVVPQPYLAPGDIFIVGLDSAIVNAILPLVIIAPSFATLVGMKPVSVGAGMVSRGIKLDVLYMHFQVFRPAIMDSLKTCE